MLHGIISHTQSGQSKVLGASEIHPVNKRGDYKCGNWEARQGRKGCGYVSCDGDFSTNNWCTNESYYRLRETSHTYQNVMCRSCLVFDSHKSTIKIQFWDNQGYLNMYYITRWY